MQLQNPISTSKCYSQIMAHLPTALQKSGHNAFQFGEYQYCLQNPKYNYNLVWLGKDDQNLGIYMGMCLPKECTSVILKESLEDLFKVLNVPLDILKIESDIQNYAYSKDFLFYFTACLLIALLIVVVIATITHKKQSKYLKSFSLQQSMKTFQMKEGSELNVFNGIRSLAMMWVVLGHTYLNTAVGGVTNLINIPEIFKLPFFLVIQAGFLSVDIFFFLGGFFLAFVFLRQKSKSLVKYPIGIIQRALRIWPCYIITMLFYYQIFMHLGSGPRWSSNKDQVNLCSNMWRSIFFFDNFADNGQAECMAWGWYLQVDFQIFLVCLLLLFLYTYRKVLSLCFASLLIIGSSIFNIVFTQQHQQKIFTDITAFQAFLDYFTSIYIRPYARWTPYIFGLYVGIAYVQYSAFKKDRTKSSIISLKLSKLKQIFEKRKIFRLMAEWFGIGLMAFLVFVPRSLQENGNWDQVWHSLYLVSSRLLFNVGILLVILPTLLGLKTSFFRTILDTKLFNFIAKISFCVYLVHYIVLSQEIAYRAYDVYYYPKDIYIQFIGVLVLSCFFGFILTVTVELPFSHLQKQFLSKIAKREAKKVSTQTHLQQEKMLLKAINMSGTDDSTINEEIS